MKMTLKLKNTVSKKEYEFTVNDLADSKLYYHFENFVLEDKMDDGSYEYGLYDEDSKLVAQGVCQIGDYEPEKKVYDKNNTVYKQYNG